jgi:predicted nucleotidyltransferase
MMTMFQRDFINKVVHKIKDDTNVLGLAVAGSFITNETDEFSDVDLVLITENKIAPNAVKMTEFAKRLDNFISGFTGEHIGDRRVLICLYDDPLIHVDIKFLTLDEFHFRVENPVVLFERNNVLSNVINTTTSAWPSLDYQWIEDRFWTWIHYATLKIGRGELFEALDFLATIRGIVIAPLLQVKNKRLPRGVRKVEIHFPKSDLANLIETVASHNIDSVIAATRKTVSLYQQLRAELFSTVSIQHATEKKVLDYFDHIELRVLNKKGA